MNKGFTLVELMISITILLVSVMSGTTYFSKFNTRQKLDKNKSEMELMVLQAQNYAAVKQMPNGITGSLKYVELSKNVNGFIEAKVNGIGVSYFSNKITDVDTTITLNPSILYFWGGTGQLSADSNGRFYSPDQTANIVISTNVGVAETRTIIINALGGIK